MWYSIVCVCVFTGDKIPMRSNVDSFVAHHVCMAATFCLQHKVPTLTIFMNTYTNKSKHKIGVKYPPAVVTLYVNFCFSSLCSTEDLLKLRQTLDPSCCNGSCRYFEKYFPRRGVTTTRLLFQDDNLRSHFLSKTFKFHPFVKIILFLIL